MGQWCPVQLALARAFAMPPRKRQAAALNALTHAVAEPVAANVLNSRATAVRTAVSGSSTTRPVVSWISPTGRRGDQLTAAGLGQHPTTQPGLDEMKLSFRHLPFHPEQEPVVE